MANFAFKYIIFLCSLLSLSSCYNEVEVRYSQEELDEKIDSLVRHFDSTQSDEFYKSYQLRRSIEVRQRAEKIVESEKSDKNRMPKNVFMDTVKLSDPE